LQGPMYRFVAVQKKPAVSCTFFQFPSHCIPTAMEGFAYISLFIVCIKENPQRIFGFALV
jgi:hypothetical protein